MRILQRIGLAIGALVNLIIGTWAQFAPQSFYDEFPTVDLTPPFSEHLMRDYGGATLGLGVVLAVAVFFPGTILGWVAPLAYLVFAVPHFAFHLHHLEGATAGEAVLLVTELALSVLLPVLLIVLAAIRTRRERPRAPGRTR
jgi:hypothetical protein